MFVYRAFGLTLASELCCPELLDGDGVPDVEIRVTPAGTRAAARPPSGFDAAPGHFELRVPMVARFRVSDGRLIEVEPHAGVDEASLRLFLLGSAMGALLHQRAVLPLQGAAVYKDGMSLLIVGPAGAGKSSLAAALGRHGWQLQSDDICAVRLEGQQAHCASGFPRQKLWPDSLTMLGDDPDGHDRVRPHMEKRSVRVPEAAFYAAAAPISTVVVLDRGRQAEALLTPVVGPRRMALLKRQTFRAQLPTRLQMHFTHFQMIAAIARQASVWRLIRPHTAGAPLALADWLAPQLQTRPSEVVQ